MTNPTNKYATEEERLEARRQSWRDSRRRRKMKRNERKEYINALLDEMLGSGKGPAERREVMVDIVRKGVQA